MSEVEAVRGADASVSIWREAPGLKGRRTAALGAFDCQSAASGARLLRDTADRLAGEGFAAVVGPMDGDTWGSHRLVVESDGRAPFLLEPQNPTHHPAAFDAAGFSVIGRYRSAEGDAEAERRSRAPRTDLSVRFLDPAEADRDLLRIHALSLRAFEGNFLYRPISADAFLDFYRPLLPMLDPELVLLAENQDGDLQAFLFGLPDRGSEAVILKTYASLAPGAGSLLADAFYAQARRKGRRSVVHALMHEDNVSARHSQARGGRVFRRYALWGVEL